MIHNNSYKRTNSFLCKNIFTYGTEGIFQFFKNFKSFYGNGIIILRNKSDIYVTDKIFKTKHFSFEQLLRIV